MIMTIMDISIIIIIIIIIFIVMIIIMCPLPEGIHEPCRRSRLSSQAAGKARKLVV